MDDAAKAADVARGRDAQSPWQMPRAAWRDILLRTWTESGADNIGILAAGVAFYAFLALVPLLACFILAYGLLADPSTVQAHLKVLFDLLPSDAAKLIGDQMLSVTQTAAKKTGLGLALAFALSLYGALNGAGSIVTAINVVYDEDETRSIFRTTLLSMIITLALVAVGVLGVLAIGALAFLEGLIPGAPHGVIVLVRVAFWVAATLGASSVIACVYRYAPDRRRAKWRWLTPGSLFATLGWLATTLGFGFYAANFGHYNVTYGALGAVVVLLMWMYLSSYIMLFGAELNSEIEHQTEVDTTHGHDRPLGERRAYVADTVGKVP